MNKHSFGFWLTVTLAGVSALGSAPQQRAVADSHPYPVPAPMAGVNPTGGAVSEKPTAGKPVSEKPSSEKLKPAPAALPQTPGVTSTPEVPRKPANPPVGPTSPAAGAPGKPVEAASAKTRTIVDIATGDKNFQTFSAALKATGLIDTLAQQGPFTVFAPTDAAFAALPQGTLEKLMLPENKQVLRQLLSYHVVLGTVLSKDLKSGAVNTAEGSPVTVKVEPNQVMVNQAKVTTADLQASNGVMHVVDQVIMPPMTSTPPASAPATPSATPATPTTKPAPKLMPKPELPKPELPKSETR